MTGKRILSLDFSDLLGFITFHDYLIGTTLILDTYLCSMFFGPCLSLISYIMKGLVVMITKF